MTKTIIVHNPDNLPTAKYTDFIDLQGDLKSLPKENQEQLKNSITNYGIRFPAFIWQSEGKKYIVDAHQRKKVFAILEEEGWAIPEVPYTNIYAKNKKEAAELLLQANSRYGIYNPETTFFEDFEINLDFINDIEIPELDIKLDELESGEEQKYIKLTDKFIVPPFSVLDTRQGYWQERKRAWLSLGIESELGRSDNLTFGNFDKYQKRYKNNISEFDHYRVKEGKRKTMDEQRTSIFDPVLAEIAYKWFCPQSGEILDPFAGGSVRGIVAAYLGYNYTGIDLREEQIETNKKQWTDISLITESEDTQTTKDFIEVKISNKWLKHKFQCNEEYITTHCHGRCREGTNKVVISLLPEEAEAMIKQGYNVIDGLLQPNNETGKCPFKKASGLCGIHDSDLKPFGCIASPFTLNNANTLIIRNRYSLLKCHGSGEPSYITFKSSLNLIFGIKEADKIVDTLKTSDNDFMAKMPYSSYKNLKYLDSLKHKNILNKKGNIKWITGNAEKITEITNNQYDFIFSCPPYYNLEVYSNLEGDLSAKETYEQFLESYHKIIEQCVSLLKEDRFACFVVADIRDKKGFYRNFVSDTIAGYHKAGMALYNEAILVNVIGSLPIRVGPAFGSYRKLGKCHQNVLVFYKGDIAKIKENYVHIEVEDIIPEGAN